MPSFEILVEDLAHLSNEDLQDLALAAFPKLVLWALRDARDAEQLERNLDDWATIFAEALTARSEELMQRGRAEGQVTLIVKMLTRKFGDLPAEYRARLETATTDLLERYAERLLGAGTLAAVFADD